MESAYAEDFKLLEEGHKALETDKKIAQNEFSEALNSNDQTFISTAKSQMQFIIEKEKNNRAAAKALISKANDSVETNDKDYVFIHFILNYLPKGLVGLLLAVILSAAMSSTASELNALGTTTALDLYKRNKKEEYSPEHYVKVSKLFTLLWGIVAIFIACVANLFDNLIQLVNIIGSIFYGNILGMFLLAFFFRYVKGNAVFIAAIITQIVVILVWYLDWMGYLWLNALGCLFVILLAVIFESFDRLHKNPPIKTL
jgi:Na+/proline symporter